MPTIFVRIFATSYIISLHKILKTRKTSLNLQNKKGGWTGDKTYSQYEHLVCSGAKQGIEKQRIDLLPFLP